MTIHPGKLATRRRELAQEYKAKMEELAEIRKRKAFDIIKLLDEHKTVSKAELYYRITEDGQKEVEIELYCKGLLELMRSVKTEIEIINAESYNQY
jgi:hypothetical protein